MRNEKIMLNIIQKLLGTYEIIVELEHATDLLRTMDDRLMKLESCIAKEKYSRGKTPFITVGSWND